IVSLSKGNSDTLQINNNEKAHVKFLKMLDSLAIVSKDDQLSDMNGEQILIDSPHTFSNFFDTDVTSPLFIIPNERWQHKRSLKMYEYIPYGLNVELTILKHKI
ncbi:hypothetical protein L9F63_019865, partial [Diploptera punctata]